MASVRIDEADLKKLIADKQHAEQHVTDLQHAATEMVLEVRALRQALEVVKTKRQSPVALCYVAGPYRAKTGWEVDQNIQRAREAGAEVARLGVFPVVPHANTSHYDGLAPDGFWLEGTLELMRRCDMVLMIQGWERSSGARGEKAEAEKLGLPIYYSTIELAGALTRDPSVIRL